MDYSTVTLLEKLLHVARLCALEEMASGLAHELNQPIGAIATFAQAGRRMLARPDPLLAEALDVFERIGAEALSAGAGIHRIRQWFAGCAINRIVYRYSQLLDEVMPVLQLLADRCGTALTLERASELPVVVIDPLRIQHVLLTLVQNAVEASGPGPAAVHIDVTGDRFGIKTTVEDQGSGIPDAIRESIFRPFFTTKAHGTGLGLAASRTIIEKHDGQIGFENAQNGGARFWFHLPAATRESISKS